MNSWLAGGLKSSLSTLKDQVTNSIKDALEEFDEDEADNDLLDENSGRDAETRILLAVDRLRDVRHAAEDQKKEILQLKEHVQTISQEKQVDKRIL